MTGKYGNIIKKARNTESHKDGKPENQPPDESEVDASASDSGQSTQPDVNMTIKVPKAWRQHWVSKAKGEGSTLTAEIVGALTKKYGLPE